MSSYAIAGKNPEKVLEIFEEMLKNNDPLTVLNIYSAIKANILLGKGDKVMELWREMRRLSEFQQPVIRRHWFIIVAKFMSRLGREQDAKEIIEAAKHIFPDIEQKGKEEIE